ncbi:hypothetical protein BC829DRAFT_414328 [Chytridium lagenaria]|nr:hypothetical protein BC829DRAFT_414328 [Chytridium lagenaria]
MFATFVVFASDHLLLSARIWVNSVTFVKMMKTPALHVIPLMRVLTSSKPARIRRVNQVPVTVTPTMRNNAFEIMSANVDFPSHASPPSVDSTRRERLRQYLDTVAGIKQRDALLKVRVEQLAAEKGFAKASRSIRRYLKRSMSAPTRGRFNRSPPPVAQETPPVDITPPPERFSSGINTHSSMGTTLDKVQPLVDKEVFVTSKVSHSPSAAEHALLCAHRLTLRRQLIVLSVRLKHASLTLAALKQKSVEGSL